MTTATTPETIPMFDVKRSRPLPLAVAIREIVPGASTSQVLDLKGLIAREAERIARSPGKGEAVSGELINILFNICWPPLTMWLWELLFRSQPRWWGKPLTLASAAIGDIIGAASVGYWISVGISIGYLVVAVVLWWWRRKKRDPVAKLIGAKARALRDALVRRAREVARPRPVLKPAPVPR